MPKAKIKLFYYILTFLALNRFSMSWTLNANMKMKMCPKEKTVSNGTFEWKVNYKNDVKYVISKPDVCWDNGTIVLRQCDFEKGEWNPAQVQCEKFKSKNIECPEDLIELKIDGDYICLKISSQQQNFDEHFCYGSNFIIGYKNDKINNTILNFLSNAYNITSFWLPMKKYENNEFNPIVIRLPGKHWNELYDKESSYLSVDKQTLSDKKHCVAAFLKTDINKQNSKQMQIQMSHCNDFHYSVCVFKEKLVAKSGCPQNFGALSHRPNECYGITWDGQKFPDDFRMLNVTEYFKKLNTIKLIFKEFNIVDDKDVEVEGTDLLINGKWALNPESNEMKIVSSEKQLHGLCVEYIESRKNVEMILRYDPNFDTLILTVYNKFYIWSNDKPESSIHCFTNADYGELSKVDAKKIWENNSKTKSIFEIKLKSDDPGQYWCEAHTIFNFTHVSSAKVVTSKVKKGHAFATKIKTSLQPIPFPVLFDSNEMKRMAKVIKKEIKEVKKQNNFNDLIIHNVRIMDILYVSQDLKYMQCLCHITISLKSSTVDTSKERNSKEDSSSEDEDEVRHDTAIRMRARDLLIKLMKVYQPQFDQTVRSTEFCFPENEWILARIGQSATTKKFCLQKNGLPITRRCLGDFINGAYWEELKFYDCIDVQETNLITENLYSIDMVKKSKSQPEKALKDVRKLLETNLKKIIPADFYYLAKIIRNSIRAILKPSTVQINNYYPQSFTLNNISEITVEIVRIFNYLLEVNDHVIRPSIALNSTNILLDAFEYLIDQISSVETFQANISSITNQSLVMDANIEDNDKEIEIIEYEDVGVIVKMATNFLAFVIRPEVANVTGIALFHADYNMMEEFYDEGILKGAFKNEYYRLILANQSVEELLNEPNILMATFVPTSLWDRLDEISMLSNRTWQTQRPEPKIVIKIYANDKLFQETNLNSDKTVDGRVISISIPGHDTDLPEILPLILTISDVDVSENEHENNTTVQNQYCSYWNYQAWASDGIMLLARSELSNNTVLCGCTHLTPFAYLIGGSYNLSVDSDIEVIVKKIHKQALDIITLLGCSLSLFGIACIFVTACTFRSWRIKANSKVLLQLSAAIALQMILFCFVNTEEYSLHLITNKIFTSCIAIGACLHYSVLVQFCWMVIIAYLQFKRYVQVFGNTRPKRFFIKSTILGWGLPVVPVACVLVFDSDSYIPQQTNPLCYPSGFSLYIGIVLPITLVIVANLLIFIVVIYNILKNPAGAIRHTEKSLAISQIRLLVLLFFLLGFTWIFGLLNTMKAGIVFSYLFCLTATLQGFILFVYFILMDPVTRRMWYGYFRKLFGLKPNLENSSSVKETTQSF